MHYGTLPPPHSHCPAPPHSPYWIVCSYIVVFPSSYIAVAMVAAAYLATGFLVMYIKVRGLHKLTWGGWSFKSLDNWWLFLKLGLPGFLMVAFEWWTFEISVLVSGSLGETALGVNTILLQLLTLMFMVSHAPTPLPPSMCSWLVTHPPHYLPLCTPLVSPGYWDRCQCQSRQCVGCWKLTGSQESLLCCPLPTR